jgi:cellulose synthase/poly-beta-1,6-N-acetylglucosamine synthase-like glycosyltransferase
METGYETRKEVTLSFVIPLKDEAPTLEELFNKIAQHASARTSLWEVIFVDDGSTDNSWQVIQELASENPDRIKAIRFRRNLGKPTHWQPAGKSAQETSSLRWTPICRTTLLRSLIS